MGFGGRASLFRINEVDVFSNHSFAFGIFHYRLVVVSDINLHRFIIWGVDITFFYCPSHLLVICFHAFEKCFLSQWKRILTAGGITIRLYLFRLRYLRKRIFYFHISPVTWFNFNFERKRNILGLIGRSSDQCLIILLCEHAETDDCIQLIKETSRINQKQGYDHPRCRYSPRGHDSESSIQIQTFFKIYDTRVSHQANTTIGFLFMLSGFHTL